MKGPKATEEGMSAGAVVRRTPGLFSPLLPAALWLCLSAAALTAQDSAEALTAGKAAIEDGFHELAEKNLRTYLSSAPKGSAETDAATVLLARACHGQGKYQEALGLLARMPGAPAAYWRAMALHGLGKYDQALAELSDFDGRYQDETYAVRAARLAAASSLKVGRTNDALAAFARIEEKHGASAESIPSLLEWARTLSAAGERDKAVEVLRKLAAKSPHSEAGQQGRLLLGRILAAGGEFKEADAVLNELARMQEAEPANRTAAFLAMGEVRAAQNLFSEATNALQTAVDIAPDPQWKRQSEIATGRLLLRMKKVEEAIAFLKRYISAVPADDAAPSLQLEVAAAFLDAGNAARAAEEYQHYLEAFTDSRGKATALSGKGWALLMMTTPSYEEAAGAFRQAYELFTEPADKMQCLMKAADAHFSNRQYGLATQGYEQAVREFPDSPLSLQARFQLAECAARNGKPEEAVKLFQAVIDLRAESALAERALMRIAEIKEDLGDLSAALSAYEEFVKQYTNAAMTAKALLSHGIINYRTLRFEAALQDFERLIARYPDTESAEQAHYMRGRCFQILGPEDKALAAWRGFLAAYPNSKKWAVHALFRLGEYAFNHGEYREAQAQFSSIAEKYPENALAPGALLWAGQAAAKQKEYLVAIEYFAELVKRYPDSTSIPRARYEQGDATTELGEYAKAILIFEEIIRKYPESDLIDMAWCRKADCEFALGVGDSKRYESAIASYRVVADKAGAAPDLKLQAQYKIGTCLRKLNRLDEAVEQYYSKAMIPYLDDAKGSLRGDPACESWFTRAAFDAVDILESQKKLREAIRILRRVVESGVPAADEAGKRIDRIRLQMWILP